MKHIKRLSTSQVKNRYKIMLGIGVFFLLLMIGLIIYGLLAIATKEGGSNIVLSIPAIICPLSIFPILYADRMKKELKYRESA